MKRFVLLLLFVGVKVAFGQDVLIPFRVGDLFGLSDIKGNLKVKPVYDYIEPIGEGYFKYSNFTKIPDTIHWVSGRIEIREKITTRTGVLFGKNVIIQNSKHRHFTVVENKIIIGSEESYISKNSNFYNLKGKKLLPENVEKFKFLASDKNQFKNTPVIAVFAEHFDKSFSILLYDVKKQNFIKPLISHGKNVKVDRTEYYRDNIILSYNDDDYNSYKVSIYFDDNKQTFVKEPFIRNIDRESFDNDLKGYNDVVEVPSGMEDVRVEEPRRMDSGNTKILKSSPTVIPKKVFPFIRINDSLVTYNGKEIKPMTGEKFIFPDRYSKSQKEPIIFTSGEKFGLLFPDSSEWGVLYDSLRYIKNQYGIFSSGYNYIYLAGIRNTENNKWVFGIIDSKGKEIIPLNYESVIPNLLEIYLNDNNIKNKNFEFRQPYNYSNDKNALLTLYSDAVFTVSKNGKSGVINIYNEVLLPLEYNKVWKNGISFLKTFKVQEDFCVYQKDGLFGVFKLKPKSIAYNSGLKFPKIPVYAYLNYLGIKDLNIYNLATEENLFFCLASDDGTIYYREK